MDNPQSRSETLVEVFNEYVDKEDSILEIGCGDGRNIRYLKEAGYGNVIGIDKIYGTAIEDEEFKQYDIIYTMSTLFLIPSANEWVFEKIASMASKYLILFEGETTKGNGVVGRDYNEVFSKFGFTQVEHETPMFNQYGHLRIMKKL